MMYNRTTELDLQCWELKHWERTDYVWMLGEPWKTFKNHGKTMGKSWKTMGQSLETHSACWGFRSCFENPKIQGPRLGTSPGLKAPKCGQGTKSWSQIGKAMNNLTLYALYSMYIYICIYMYICMCIYALHCLYIYIWILICIHICNTYIHRI